MDVFQPLSLDIEDKIVISKNITHKQDDCLVAKKENNIIIIENNNNLEAFNKNSQQNNSKLGVGNKNNSQKTKGLYFKNKKFKDLRENKKDFSRPSKNKEYTHFSIAIGEKRPFLMEARYATFFSSENVKRECFVDHKKLGKSNKHYVENIFESKFFDDRKTRTVGTKNQMGFKKMEEQEIPKYISNTAKEGWKFKIKKDLFAWGIKYPEVEVTPCTKDKEGQLIYWNDQKETHENVVVLNNLSPH